MMPATKRRPHVFSAFALCGLCAIGAVLASAAPAQIQSGNLYGTITDKEGDPLEGVKITLRGVAATQSKSSDRKGQVRFLALAPGTYKLEAEFDGYSRVVYMQISIRVGRNTTLQLKMSSVLEETVTVTTEPPLLDRTDMTSDVTVTEFELDEIPTARDPWAILDQAPGVIVDRVNVGGSESGQQPLFVGTGSSSRENAYVVDGVNVTDMAAIGASPTYYDFGQLGEMQVTTGGGDAEVVNAGVTLNMVTKRGSNDLRGSVRVFTTDGSWQSSPNVDAGDFAPGQEQTTTNRIRGVHEYGLELGGPLVRDRLFAWGAYSLNDIARDSLGGTRDDIDLENLALKLNAQPTRSTSAVLSFSQNYKDRFGRGAGLARSEASLWDQTGGADLLKAELSHMPSSNLYLSGLYSLLDADFALDPRGGADAEILLDADGVWQGSFVATSDSRDSEQLRLNGAQYFNALGAAHELEAGASQRLFETVISERWGPRNLIHYAKENLGETRAGIDALRIGPLAVEQEYLSLWLQDTISTKSTTVRLGLRYDVQDAENLAGVVAASPVFPALLPAVSYPGRDVGFTWEMISPRLGVTRALGTDARTLLRASYSRYPSQLHAGLAARVSLPFYGGAFFLYDDLDGDLVYDDGEPVELQSTFGVDPENPLAVDSPNLNDPGLEPEVTDELIVGLQRGLSSRFLVGLDFTYRRMSSILEGRRLIRTPEQVRVAERSDYRPAGFVAGELPGDRGYFEIPVYTLQPGVEYTGGAVLTNGDREQSYLATSVTLTKRMADRWMLRGHLTMSDWTWEIGPEFWRFDDPTDLAISYGPDGLLSSSDSQGEVVAEPSRAKESTLFLNSGWSFNISSLYQVAPERRWGFNVAANVQGREGFPAPYRVVAVPKDGLRREVQVTPAGDSFRYDDLFITDLRLEKELGIGRVLTVLSFDVFNLFNEGFVLERSLQLNGPQPDYLLQTLNPRVLRLGVRVSWN